jgi:hypothetical protein
MEKRFAVALSVVAGIACGGSEKMELSDASTMRIRVTRDGSHPNYLCEGTIKLGGGSSQFGCSAEGFADWTVSGTAEQFRLVDVLRFWVRASGTGRPVGQPEIAIDLEWIEGRYSGWATVILPDGTGFGHIGATAEGWLEDT